MKLCKEYVYSTIIYIKFSEYYFKVLQFLIFYKLVSF